MTKVYLLITDIDNGGRGYEKICGAYSTIEKAIEAAKIWIPEYNPYYIAEQEIEEKENDDNKYIRVFSETCKYKEKKYRDLYFIHQLYVKELDIQ